MRNRQRSAAVRAEMLRDVKACAAGEKLPPQRELLRRYGAGRRTLDAILAEFEREGLIERVPYVGIFCRYQGNARKRHIVQVTADWVPDAFRQVTDIYRKLLRDDPEFQFSCLALPEPYYKNLNQIAADVLLLSAPTSDLSPADLEHIRRLKVPAVFLTRHFPGLAMHDVDSNPELAGALIFDYLLAKGHEKLAVLIAEPRCLEVEMEVKGFCNQAWLRKVPVEILDCRTRLYESSCGRAYDHLSEVLRKEGCGFTALFVVNDWAVPGALKALRENDLEIPADVSVIGHDALPQGAFYAPPLTSCSSRQPETAVKVMQKIRDYFAGRTEWIRVEEYPEIVERESVAVRHRYREEIRKTQAGG